MVNLSCIVPIYNSEKYLSKCLDSLTNQTMKNYEVILVDDGSTDNSKKIVDEYIKLYPDKFKYFYQKNMGQASARNLGLKKAEGEYIFFVDSDDYLELDACQKVYECANENDYDILSFELEEELEDGTKKSSNYYKFTDVSDDKKYILCETSSVNKIIRKSILIENNLQFVENYIYEDLELIPRLILYTKKVCFIEDKLYHYVIHNNSTMRQKEYNSKLQNIFFVMNSLKNSLENTEYKEELEYLYIEHLLHGAVLRYLDYEEGYSEIIKISEIMRKNFPKWKKNKYFQIQNIKYKIFCILAYSKKINLLKRILKK